MLLRTNHHHFMHTVSGISDREQAVRTYAIFIWQTAAKDRSSVQQLRSLSKLIIGFKPIIERK